MMRLPVRSRRSLKKGMERDGSLRLQRRVIRSKTGRHWFDDAVIEAKLKNFRWHDLRHTFASRLRMKGTPLEDIADLLGHKSLTMTRRYAHLGPNKLHAVVSLLGSSDPTSDTGQIGESAAASQVAVQ